MSLFNHPLMNDDWIRSWGVLKERECVNLQNSSTSDPSQSSYQQCWRCKICNFILNVKATRDHYNNVCFRCNQSKFEMDETETFWHKYWKEPNDFHWLCFECKNLNTNVKSHWCSFEECCGRKIVTIANEIPYKPTDDEINSEKSRIAFFVEITNVYAVYLRLCTRCGCRCGNVICSVCEYPKRILIGTVKMNEMVQGFIRQIQNNVPVRINKLIYKYCSG